MNSLLHPLLPTEMVTRHDAVGIRLSALLATRVARRTVAADLAAATVQTCRLFSMLARGGCGAPRAGLHEYAAGGLLPCALAQTSPDRRVRLVEVAGGEWFGLCSQNLFAS